MQTVSQQYEQETQRRSRHQRDSSGETEDWAGFLPLMMRLFSHGLAGFLTGVVGYILLAVLLIPLSGSSLLSFGLAIPVVSTVLGFVRAVQCPIPWLSRPLAIIGLLALGTTLFALVFYVAIMAILSVRMCG
jgi:thiol:disulfide interchange protein